jgi:DNA-binding protein H-NS
LYFLSRLQHAESLLQTKSKKERKERKQEAFRIVDEVLKDMGKIKSGKQAHGLTLVELNGCAP